jgi:hypothetical protein
LKDLKIGSNSIIDIISVAKEENKGLLKTHLSIKDFNNYS